MTAKELQKLKNNIKKRNNNELIDALEVYTNSIKDQLIVIKRIILEIQVRHEEFKNEKDKIKN